MTEKDDAEREAVIWSRASIAAAVVIILLSASASAIPVVIVQLLSIIACLMYLFTSWDETAMTMLFVAAGFEVASALVLLVFGAVLLTSPGYSGWGVVLGIYALVITVPVLVVAAVDVYTALRIREHLFGRVRVSPVENPSPFVPLKP